MPDTTGPLRTPTPHRPPATGSARDAPSAAAPPRGRPDPVDTGPQFRTVVTASPVVTPSTGNLAKRPLRHCRRPHSPCSEGGPPSPPSLPGRRVPRRPSRAGHRFSRCHGTRVANRPASRRRGSSAGVRRQRRHGARSRRDDRGAGRVRGSGRSRAGAAVCGSAPVAGTGLTTPLGRDRTRPSPLPNGHGSTIGIALTGGWPAGAAGHDVAGAAPGARRARTAGAEPRIGPVVVGDG